MSFALWVCKEIYNIRRCFTFGDFSLFLQRKVRTMKKWLLIILISFATTGVANAQCSICTKTASQLGETPAKGLNAGIIYLMAMPLSIAGFIGYKWWQREKEINV